MNIQSIAGNGFTTLVIAGKLDAVSAAEAETSIDGAIAGGATRLVLNLAGLEYISSAGLRVLLATAKKLSRQNGRIALCGLRQNVREVFEISGLMSIFQIAADEAAAQALVTQ